MPASTWPVGRRLMGPGPTISVGIGPVHVGRVRDGNPRVNENAWGDSSKTGSSGATGHARRSGPGRRPGRPLAADLGPVHPSGQGSRRHLRRLRPGQRPDHRGRRPPQAGPQRQHDRPRRRRLPHRPDAPRSPERPALGLLPRCAAPRPEVRRDRGRSPDDLRGGRARPGVRPGAARHSAAGRRAAGEGARRRGLLHPRGRLALRAGHHHLRQPGHRPRSTPSCWTRSAPIARSSAAPTAPADLFWAYDKHFGQAYGVVADGHEILGANARQLLLRYRDRDGKVAVRLRTGRVVPADAPGHPRGKPLRRPSASPIGWPGRPIIPSASR